MLSRHALGAIVATALLVCAALPAQAVTLATNTRTYTDPISGGSVEITSRVEDNFAGDFSKYTFEYEVFNIDFDPTPGTSNGYSGFQTLFLANVPGVADQFAPPLWSFNCCSVGPPFGAEFDIRNSDGLGVLPGFTDVFGFSVPAGTGWTDAYTGSWGHSWELDVQVNIFNLQEAGSGLSILTPIAGAPEPSVLALLAVGLLGLGLRRSG